MWMFHSAASTKSPVAPWGNRLPDALRMGEKLRKKINLKSLILLYLISPNVYQSQNPPPVGFVGKFDKSDSSCSAQFHAIAQQTAKGHGGLLSTRRRKDGNNFGP
jgi:hypothetical protein